MKRILPILIIAISFNSSFSQTISKDRLVDWSKSRLANTINTSTNTFNFQSFGGNPDGVTANDSILDLIMDSIGAGSAATIFFPNGDYLFNKKINLESNLALSGESSDSTILRFDLSSATDLISANGKGVTTDTFTISSDIRRGDLFIDFTGDTTIRNLRAGDFIQLYDNDSSKVTSSWAYKSTGQIVKVDSVVNDTLYIANQLRRHYLSADNPYAIRVEMMENIQIEKLSIIRLDSTGSQTSNIDFNYVYNSAIRCIQSNFCNFSHIALSYSSNVEITGSFFKDGYGYGGGGRAYGIVLQFASGECLVSGNKLEHLRHSILLQAGANGNVIGYNYSTDPFWTGVAAPSDGAGDLVLHGNYVYTNLFEGNITQTIVIDNSHGINGPFNTFFRNRAELYGLVMNTTQATDSANFVGNEMTNTGPFKGNYILAGNGHFEHGNNQKGTILPPGTSTLNDSSYYLMERPSYYVSNSAWPPIGTPNAINVNSIEAKEEYENGDLTNCNTAVVGIEEAHQGNTSDINVYPNPTQDNLYLITNSQETYIRSAKVISSTGQLSLEYFGRIEQINLTTVKSGLYFLQLELSDGQIISKKIIKR